MRKYKSNAVIIGLLFIITMLFGLIDASFVIPKLNVSLTQLNQNEGLLLLGVFSVFAMALGIVGIAIMMFPIIKEQSETIALTYISFRVIEGLLYIFGVIAYILLIVTSKANIDNNVLDANVSSVIPQIAYKIKDYAYQLAMLLLGFNSLFLCYSFYKSKIIPRFLSIWGFIGYLLLFFSAVLALFGTNGTSGIVKLLYIPGGLWEFVAFPIWLFVKGFAVVSHKE